MVPTAVITAKSGNVTVTFYLYGAVSAERYEKEQKLAIHRAFQLS
jgi:hypothetical protein